MPSKTSTSPNTPRPQRWFSRIVGVQIVILAVLLGVLGYRDMERRSLASTDTEAQKQLPSPGPAPATKRVSPPKKKTPSPSPVRPLPVLRDPMILIEKSGKRLTVFDAGRFVKSYPAAVGAEKGDKVREGDLRTPEGEFYVCVKNAQSKYARALGLSYPSLEDARRGLRSGRIGQRDYDRIAQAIRRHRQPPWNTALGGAIMIHGDRCGGRETQGCIALEDSDIRELFARIPLGTRVVIQP